MTPSVTFTLYGKVVGVNRIKTPVHIGPKKIRILKTSRGREDHQRVNMTAFMAAREVGWVIPEACAVYITAHNSRLDIDASPKIILDGMKKAIYADDRSIIELHIFKTKDLGEERYDIRVEPRDVIVRPKAPKLTKGD